MHRVMTRCRTRLVAFDERSESEYGRGGELMMRLDTIETKYCISVGSELDYCSFWLAIMLARERRNGSTFSMYQAKQDSKSRG